jgi:hypothetical protein
MVSWNYFLFRREMDSTRNYVRHLSPFRAYKKQTNKQNKLRGP